MREAPTPDADGYLDDSDADALEKTTSASPVIAPMSSVFPLAGPARE